MALLSQQCANYIADNMENYIDIMESCVIVNNITEEDYTKSVKKVRKAIKNLREGKLEKVLNPEKVALVREMLEKEAARANGTY